MISKFNMHKIKAERTWDHTSFVFCKMIYLFNDLIECEYTYANTPNFDFEIKQAVLHSKGYRLYYIHDRIVRCFR